jgi:hypothetical protein
MVKTLQTSNLDNYFLKFIIFYLLAKSVCGASILLRYMYLYYTKKKQFCCCLLGLDHQKADWSHHKTTCSRPFKVEVNPVAGRVMVATRYIGSQTKNSITERK